MRLRLKSLLSAEVSTGADFTQEHAKKAFSLVNDQADLDYRPFQQNLPISALGERQLGSILLKKSAMASAAEKYAPDVEIFTFG